MDLDKDTQEKVKELQFLEQNLNNLLMQKQAFQIELTETENAISEMSQSKDEVYKLVGNILIKSDKNKIEGDLKKRKEIIALRVKSIERQESSIAKQAEELKKEVLKKIR